MRSPVNLDVVRSWARGRRPSFPDVVTLVLDRDRVNEQRAVALRPARGAVLEIGFGSGLNLDQYPAAVNQLLGVDPDLGGAENPARDPAGAPFDVDTRQMSVEELDLPDASFDTVVATFTLCSVADPARGLAEIARVLRPGGQLLFLEHGASPAGLARRAQDAVDPLWCRLANGCHLNRDVAALIADSPLHLSEVASPDRVFHPLRIPVYRGVAVKATD